VPKPLEYITKHPILWLTFYGCGTILTTAAVAAAMGGAAAGTTAGLLTLAGTIGYETLTRLKDKTKTEGRMNILAQNHDRLTREVARTRNEVDVLKDDLAKTARTLMENAKKFDEKPAPRSANGVPLKQPLMKKVQDSFARMGNRPRASSMPTPKDFKDLQMRAMARLGEASSNDDDSAVGIDTTAAPPKFTPTVIAELLHHAVQHDRIETFAQPIVKLPSRRLAYLELFARIRARAGIYLPAEQYRGLAEKETLISEVDHLLLLHALDSIRADARRDTEIGYFLNISARTLKDVGFMSDLLEFVKTNRDLAHHLIFELQQKEFENLTPPYKAVMQGLAQLGCMFSLDNVNKPQVNEEELQTLNVRFLKLDASRLVDLGSSEAGVALIERLKLKLDAVGITMVIEKIENERDLRELLDFNIDLGEGFLFGKPDLEIAYRPKKAA
jgi:cyclic-di-GMP phosphodiesterase TipF (flagellum assembly factor)